MPDKNEYMTTSEVSETLGYTVQHTRYLVREGRLQGTKMGRDWLIVRESVAEYVVHRSAQLPEAPPKRGRPRTGIKRQG